MVRPSLGRLDYERMAQEKGVTLVTKMIPSYITEPVSWRCNNCGRVWTRSYRALKKAKTGCPCQLNSRFSEEKYYDLAEKLGIEYLHDSSRIPLNTHTPVYWLSKIQGKRVTASYASLAYNPTRELRLALELDQDEYIYD